MLKHILEYWPFSDSDAREEERLQKKIEEVVSITHEEVPALASATRENSAMLLFFNRSTHKLNTMRFDKSQSWEIENLCTEEGPEVLSEMIKETCSAIATNGCIFALMWRKAVYKMDLRQPSPYWTNMRSMKYGHGRSPAAAVLNGFIYVCGGGWRVGNDITRQGWVKEFASKKVERYDISSDEWMPVASMKHGRRDNTVVAANGYVFSIGGQDENNYTLRSVERYDPNNDIWEEIASLNEPRYVAAATEFNGKLYVLGGREAEWSIEVYNFKKNCWAKLKRELKERRSYFRAFSIDGKLFAVGGDKTRGCRRSMEIYDPKAKTADVVIVPLQHDESGFESMATALLK